MSDLTERLAAKLRADRWSWTTAGDIAFDASRVLPLLLSEPELVAGLPMETKVALTCQLLGDGDLRLSVLTPRERAELRFGRAHMALESECQYVPGQVLGESYHAALAEFNAALAEARALPPEVPRGK